MDKEPLIRILSLGAGVQSSTMALMADQGAFGKKPDAAIFADTGWEPEPVLEHFRMGLKDLNCLILFILLVRVHLLEMIS